MLAGVASGDMAQNCPRFSYPLTRNSGQYTPIGFQQPNACELSVLSRFSPGFPPGDFTRWKDHDGYQKVLTRLLSDLSQSEKS